MNDDLPLPPTASFPELLQWMPRDRAEVLGAQLGVLPPGYVPQGAGVLARLGGNRLLWIAGGLGALALILALRARR